MDSYIVICPINVIRGTRIAAITESDFCTYALLVIEVSV